MFPKRQNWSNPQNGGCLRTIPNHCIEINFWSTFWRNFMVLVLNSWQWSFYFKLHKVCNASIYNIQYTIYNIQYEKDNIHSMVCKEIQLDKRPQSTFARVKLQSFRTISTKIIQPTKIENMPYKMPSSDILWIKHVCHILARTWELISKFTYQAPVKCTLSSRQFVKIHKRSQEGRQSSSLVCWWNKTAEIQLPSKTSVSLEDEALQTVP